jgi:hypothetical protein
LMFEAAGEGMNEAHVRNLIKQNHRQRRATGGLAFELKRLLLLAEAFSILS